MSFEENRGQADSAVRYLARGSGYTVFLTGGEAVLVLSQAGADRRAKGDFPRRANAREDRRGQPAVAIRTRLVGAREPSIAAAEPLPGTANYFIGNDPAFWRTAVPTFAQVHYRGVYPGIDLVYYGKGQSLEYDGTSHPVERTALTPRLKTDSPMMFRTPVTW
jgi:hypothetical protein